jgi:hypothetical protein
MSVRLTEEDRDGTVTKTISRFSELAAGDPSPGLVLLAAIRASGLWTEFAGEKILAPDQLGLGRR